MDNKEELLLFLTKNPGVLLKAIGLHNSIYDFYGYSESNKSDYIEFLKQDSFLFGITSSLWNKLMESFEKCNLSEYEDLEIVNEKRKDEWCRMEEYMDVAACLQEELINSLWDFHR